MSEVLEQTSKEDDDGAVVSSRSNLRVRYARYFMGLPHARLRGLKDFELRTLVENKPQKGTEYGDRQNIKDEISVHSKAPTSGK